MDIREIKELIKAVEKSDLTEFEYENDTERVYLSKSSGEVMTVAAPQPVAQPQVVAAAAATPAAAPVAAPAPAAVEDAGGTPITSPIVGTFYEAPSPDAPAFVKVGDVVSKGQTLCIVEAMKIMNEIEAEFDCKIVKILGTNAKPVEYGETIFVVEPA